MDHAKGTASPLTLGDLLRLGDLLNFGDLRERVIVSPWVPDDTIYIMNATPDGRPIVNDFPAGWDEMSATEKVEWAVRHGLIVAISNVK